MSADTPKTLSEFDRGRAAGLREGASIFEPHFWAGDDLRRMATGIDGIASDGFPVTHGTDKVPTPSTETAVCDHDLATIQSDAHGIGQCDGLEDCYRQALNGAREHAAAALWPEARALWHFARDLRLQREKMLPRSTLGPLPPVPRDPRGPGIIDSHWVTPNPAALNRPRSAVTSGAPPPEQTREGAALPLRRHGAMPGSAPLDTGAPPPSEVRPCGPFPPRKHVAVGPMGDVSLRRESAAPVSPGARERARDLLYEFNFISSEHGVAAVTKLNAELSRLEAELAVWQNAAQRNYADGFRDGAGIKSDVEKAEAERDRERARAEAAERALADMTRERDEARAEIKTRQSLIRGAIAASGEAELAWRHFDETRTRLATCDAERDAMASLAREALGLLHAYVSDWNSPHVTDATPNVAAHCGCDPHKFLRFLDRPDVKSLRGGT